MTRKHARMAPAKIWAKTPKLALAAALSAAVAHAAANSESAAPKANPKIPAWETAAAKAPPAERIDATTQKSLYETFTKVLMSLDDAEQQKFAAAMATISVIVAEDKSADVQKKLFDAVHGKTADEIIAASRRLTPYIRKYSNIIDSSSEDAFNRSVGRVMVSLPPEQQGKFSESVAKLMYQAQKDRVPPEEFRKKLDAKTADEVIWMAERINMPFAIVNSDTARHTTISPLSPEEAERLKKEFGEVSEERENPSEKKEKSLQINLSPSSILKGGE